MRLLGFVKSFIRFFLIRKLAATVIVVTALVNLLAWGLGKVSIVNYNYDINTKATMKIVTTISFLILGMLLFIKSKKYHLLFFILGISIQVYQVLLISFALQSQTSSPVTVCLFVLSFTEIFYRLIARRPAVSLTLNCITYLLVTFSIYQFVINPVYLASIPGFESLSWGTLILFYIYVLSTFQIIFRRNINRVFHYNSGNDLQINPFKYFPVYFMLPILIIIITSFLVHLQWVSLNSGIIIILFVLNAATIASAAIFTGKFVKLFSIILKTRSELKEQNLILTEKNTYLEDFASITSHNLKEPIIALNNLIEFRENEQYRDSITDEEMNAMLIVNIKNLSQSIDSVNKFLSVIRKGETKNFEYISLSESIRIQNEQLTDFIKQKKDTELIVKIEKDVTFPKVYIDSIVYNLLSNAYKYGKPEKPLKIIVIADYLDNNYVIKFYDNGIGINLEKYKDDIFKPNKRFHKTNVPSSGFGLYFTKMHIEKLNGTISIESDVNIGTTFTIIFKNKKNENSHN